MFGEAWKWFFSPSSLRICNDGRHPLYGKTMRVQCNAVYPYTIMDGETLQGQISQKLGVLTTVLAVIFFQQCLAATFKQKVGAHCPVTKGN